LFPGVSLRSNPGLKLANAFGVRWFDLARLCTLFYKIFAMGFA